jgi:hypothetical protein
MPRKDPMTGCTVMTMPEFLNAEAEREGKGRTGGDILGDIMSEMAADDERISDEMRKPAHALELLQEAIKENREYWDDEYAETVPEIVEVVNVIDAASHGGFGGTSSAIRAEVRGADGKLYYVYQWSSYSHGTMWEPPDGDGNFCIGEFRPMSEHPWKCYECGKVRETGARHWTHVKQSDDPKRAVHSCPGCNGYMAAQRKKRYDRAMARRARR